MSLIERVQKFDCATPDLSETVVYFHDAGAVVGGKGPVALASERLLRAILGQGQRRGVASEASENFCDKLRNEDGVANVDPTPGLRASKTRASPSLLIVRLEASCIRGKLPPRTSPLSLFYSIRFVLYGGK